MSGEKKKSPKTAVETVEASRLEKVRKMRHKARHDYDVLEINGGRLPSKHEQWGVWFTKWGIDPRWLCQGGPPDIPGSFLILHPGMIDAVWEKAVQAATQYAAHWKKTVYVYGLSFESGGWYVFTAVPQEKDTKSWANLNTTYEARIFPDGSITLVQDEKVHFQSQY